MSNQFKADEIVKVNNKDYPVVGGRLRLAHEGKALSIETTVIKYDNTIAVIQAKVTTEKGIFNGLGNATVQRDARLKNAILELAETRAIARALRFAGYGVEYTGYEEVDYEPAKEPHTPPKADNPPYKPTGNTYKCEKCDADISEKVKSFSMKKFGIPLCMDCQKTIPQ